MDLANFSARQIDRALRDAPVILTSDHPKIILFSDCHRGIGTAADSFLPNKSLYMAALSYYYNAGFTYIELGDGDELWENRRWRDICHMHSDVFQKLTEFQLAGRLYMLWGNHDRAKSSRRFLSASPECFPFLMPVFTEGLILAGNDGCPDLHLIHGHQGDILNDTLWQGARWMVRYLWKPLELAGFRDPTSAAKNYTRKENAERRMQSWVDARQSSLVAGHTHRPHLTMERGPSYYNTGSCVHPGAITCLELVYGQLTLVKWTTCVDERRYMYVCREEISGKKNLCQP